MATTVSFITSFNITGATKLITFLDTSGLPGQGVPLADVVGNFTITAPSGTTIYNNTAITNADCDIDFIASLVSQQSIVLPVDAYGLVEAGNYTIVYRVWDSNLSVYYTKTNIVNYQHASPEVCIRQRIDCITPLFSSVDYTNYSVNSISPTISGTHTLDYPVGSDGEGSPTVVNFTASSSVIAVSTFYQGTQTTEIEADLTYTVVSGVNGFIILDSVSGSKEIKVDCDYICSILCCVQAYDTIKEGYRLTNQVLFTKYDNIFQEVMSYIGLMQLAISCGLGNEVCTYLERIKTLTNCTNACNCGPDTPSRVIGLGYLIGPAGPAGEQGIQGAAGNNGNYLTITSEDPGENCTTGGQKVILYNGVTSDVISTSYICNGAAGSNGTNGTNGTNAFKFTKQFVTEEIEQNLDISEVVLTACEEVPAGCLADGTTENPFVDLHIQIWLLGVGGSWSLLINGTDYTLTISNSTGLIRAVTGNNQGTYRVVVLA
ncbi:MAG: hypothetical protein V4549_07375 [Bacteroidota bacterium]